VVRGLESMESVSPEEKLANTLRWSSLGVAMG
jgi:hypothetical protein